MRGHALVILILLGTLACHLGRWSYPERDEPPAFVVSTSNLVTIEVVGTDGAGVYQFHDGAQLESVMKLTHKIPGVKLRTQLGSMSPPVTGELFNFNELSGEVKTFERRWMPASHRILCGIPLHPDRMSQEDWEILPGVGPKLAAAIENDRQKNGDFVVFQALDRVKGVGPKKLEQWKTYFE